MDSCIHSHSQMLQDARKTFPLPDCQEDIFISLCLLACPGFPLRVWTDGQKFASIFEVLSKWFEATSESQNHLAMHVHSARCISLGKHGCSLNYCLTTYLSLIHKYQISENVKCFWKNSLRHITGTCSVSLMVGAKKKKKGNGENLQTSRWWRGSYKSQNERQA